MELRTRENIARKKRWKLSLVCCTAVGGFLGILLDSWWMSCGYGLGAGIVSWSLLSKEIDFIRNLHL